MAEGTLVREQIDDGERLIRALAGDGFEVTAAFWAQQAEDDLLFLYIASPVVDRDGLAAAYRIVQKKIREMPSPFWVDSFDVKLIGADNPIARDAIMLRGRGVLPTRVGVRQLGSTAVTGAYIYPEFRPAVTN